MPQLKCTPEYLEFVYVLSEINLFIYIKSDLSSCTDIIYVSVVVGIYFQVWQFQINISRLRDRYQGQSCQPFHQFCPTAPAPSSSPHLSIPSSDRPAAERRAAQATREAPGRPPLRHLPQNKRRSRKAPLDDRDRLQDLVEPAGCAEARQLLRQAAAVGLGGGKGDAADEKQRALKSRFF